MHNTRVSVSFFVCALLVLFSGTAHALEITGVTIASTTEYGATITWKTDEPSDATINYGLDTNFGTVRYPLFDKKTHSLNIDNLDPATTYHFRVSSTDESGNKSTTAGFVLTTKSVIDKKRVEKILKEIDEVKDPEELLEIQKIVNQQVSDIVQPPSIVGPPKVSAESSTAEITWTTDRESSSMVYFAPEGDYSSSKKNPYSLAQGDPKDLTTKHKVTLRGLEPSTTYHFIVSSEDKAGLTGESNDDTFKTKSKLPEIINPRVSRIQETSALITWSTGGVLAKGIVEYTNLRSKVKKLAGNPVFATNHSIQLADLEFGSRYSAVIRTTNEGGDEIVSNPLNFVTVRDVVPPEIAKVNNESTLFPGEEVKIQTIISWETDEPALCQVFYSQGLARQIGDLGDSLPKEANPLTAHTQVIVGFASATVYQFWLFCEDPSGNESRSEDFVLITPVKEKSIIDIILENFEGTFGWLKNVGG